LLNVRVTRHWFVFEHPAGTLPFSVWEAQSATANGVAYWAPYLHCFVYLKYSRTDVEMDLITPFAVVIASPITPDTSAPLYKTTIREYFYADVPTLCVDPK
jgi:hypothetical protein